MDENRNDRGQHDPSGESVVPEDHQKELIKKFENGYPSVFQELLANDMEQLQHQIETIAAQEGNCQGLTKEVIKALFAGIQAKIADRKFVRWIARTGAKAALENLRGASPPDRIRGNPLKRTGAA